MTHAIPDNFNNGLKMKIAVMGSGGVGGFYGGLLARAGAEVTFVARGAHLAAMRERGLLIENETQGNTEIRNVRVTEDPASIGVVDLVLIAVKLWDLDAAVHAVKPLVGPQTAVLSLQNGVIKDDILRRAFGDRAVMGGVGYVATHISRPGVIRQVGTLQRLIFGEYDGVSSARVEALLALALKAGLQAESVSDIHQTGIFFSGLYQHLLSFAGQGFEPFDGIFITAMFTPHSAEGTQFIEIRGSSKFFFYQFKFFFG